MIRGQIASDYVQLRDPRKINSLNVLKMNLCSLAQAETERYRMRLIRFKAKLYDLEHPDEDD